LNGFKAKEQNPKIKATLDQIISFAERPGFITISSKAKQKFTLAKIDNMDPLEVIDFFDLKVNQGPKDLKTAVTEIKKQL
ncbi:MAG: hypothetical protein IJS50_01865, partial [Desulfovibrio sp.]|nr:hypothetical protein [Desulfovibrio sp.]